MEFLRTPDPSAAWAVTPRTTNGGPAGESNDSTVTPVPSSSPPNNGNLDRSTIKSSFQTLFTPIVGSTPQYFGKHGPPSGLTPFINGGITPNLVTPGIGMMPPSTLLQGDLTVPQNRSMASPTLLMSSPYLQAAAKEAVRREFMNMPTYIAGQGHMSPSAGEQTVPGGPTSQQQLVHAKNGALVNSRPVSAATPISPATSRVKPTATQPDASPSSEARVPEPQRSNSATVSPSQRPPQSSATAEENENPQSPGNQRVPQPGAPTVMGQSSSAPASAPVLQQQQAGPYYQMPPQHGMYLMPQNGGMMMQPPPGNAVFIHPATGMMMLAPPGPGGAGQIMQHPGMMIPMHPAQMHVNRAPMKPETHVERKERIEREKQDLIREFKKKTREAALVRFRQKRRERRFGKLIRYDCRKKLADARPRVKGRFVRIKADCNPDDEDSAQVVPSMQ